MADMALQEAMRARHMVRKYTGKEIPADIVAKLNERVSQNNERHRLSIKLVTNDGGAIPGVIKLILAKGVNNYFIMAGPEGADERLGYCGADLMLYAQTLGLNTWWVGGTFNRKGAAKKIGFPGLCMHELRHTQATQLLGAGVDLKTVQARMGHAKASHTLDLYAHAIPANDRDAANIMGSLYNVPAAPAQTSEAPELDKSA